MATIADVCKEAGVSSATVSRVLNGTGQVSPKTRDRVFTAINKLGYTPNTLARALATNKTNTIGLIVPGYDGSYYGTMLNQAAEQCEQAGKQIFVTDGRYDSRREKEAILMLSGRRCDGIILYSRTISEETMLELKRTIDVPLVTIGRNFSDERLPCVIFDQFNAGYTITKHLLSLGHRDIACITGTMNTLTAQERLAGYREALTEFGIPYRPELVESGHYHFLGGYQACQTIMARNVKFTAIFSCSDEMAIGVEKALFESGLSIPEQISVVGIDNSGMSNYAHVPLTTIDIPIKEMMRKVVEITLDMIHSPDAIHGETRFVGELIERSSSAPLIEEF
ncbi:LacI family DNA-binding transcriptional regulator [Vibrio mangrovi]|uniref:HTH-type transcriptional regulator AscG n=1 Tax=Vibrio mangrovi TaxID=474394 RepID=A0A1Y6IU98_9VIBR|nr:LacI family DNA-binding transcriptional regulator [Vibrio mangrovi]MDW6002982.1 LacI family DNA-binding transcriptional regulator [Vibrio mangrovi]SMS01224.1 HTH-type transcriptional regulator AscG [Vibrio mangrovi]